MKLFFLKLFLFSLVIAIADFCWIRFMPVNKHVPHTWAILGTFVILTALFHFLTLNAAKGRPQAFVRYYMASTGLRMMLYIAIIIAYRFINKPQAVPFALGFMAHYILFTVFEVTALLKSLREQA